LAYSIQSFIAGVVAFKTLPRAQFSTLQQKTFPTYFGLQTALPAVLAFTYPGARGLSPFSDPGLGGLLADSNRTQVLVPIATMFVTSLANLVYLGPTTTKVMIERKHQGMQNGLRKASGHLHGAETRDGKRSYDSGPQSTEMEKLNKKFGALHGASTVVNLIGFGAMIWYGATIARRM
jgi:hypothetical protein